MMWQYHRFGMCFRRREAREARPLRPLVDSPMGPIGLRPLAPLVGAALVQLFSLDGVAAVFHPMHKGKPMLNSTSDCPVTYRTEPNMCAHGSAVFHETYRYTNHSADTLSCSTCTCAPGGSVGLVDTPYGEQLVNEWGDGYPDYERQAAHLAWHHASSTPRQQHLGPRGPHDHQARGLADPRTCRASATPSHPSTAE